MSKHSYYQKRKRLIRKHTDIALYYKAVVQQYMLNMIELNETERQELYHLWSVHLRAVRRLKYGRIEANELYPRIDKL